MNLDIPKVLVVNHNAGFFSCNSVKLQKIIEFFNKYKQLPQFVDSSEQLIFYKNSNIDITSLYFKTDFRTTITFKKEIKISNGKNSEEQFSNYKCINFKEINPFINKYFSHSDEVMKYVYELETKYKINYKNTCSLFFRGNDKCKETNQPTYEEFFNKAISITNNNPDTTFLLQTDEDEFVNYCKGKFKNFIYFSEVPRINSNPDACIGYLLSDLSADKQKYTLYYLASVYILSKCKEVVLTSGNGEMFCVFFRGNANNVYQYLNPKEYIYDVKNEDYDSSQNQFWFA
jgi:hypothetical protein